MEDSNKLHEETLKIAKSLMESDPALKDWVTEKFPELKESEDERIRKEILELISISGNGNQFEEIKDWLEKQGEQKPTIIIPKFRVGDKIVSTKNRRLTYTILEVGIINELGNPEYKVEIFTDGKAGILNKEHNIQNIEMSQMDDWGELVEYNPTEWSKEDWKHYHKLEMFLEVNERYSKIEKSSGYQKDVHEILLWLKSRSPKHVAWSEEDEKRFEYCKRLVYASDKYSIEDREETVDWLKSLKDRVLPQPKQEWSKDDKEMIRHICCYLNEYGNWLSDKNDEKSQSIYKACDWLKSLKDRMKGE